MDENEIHDGQEGPSIYTNQPIEEKRSRVPAVVITLSFLLLLIGLTIYAFMSAFQEEQREHKGVEFPFDREVAVMFTSSKDIPEQIRNVAVRNSGSDEFLEIVFQERKNPLFVTDILENFERGFKNSIKSFSVGAHKGDIFLLINFNTDAFLVISSHPKDVSQTIDVFTGKESGREIERIKRANTDIVIMENDILYGFLNKNMIAVTETEGSFMEILDVYRSSY